MSFASIFRAILASQLFWMFSIVALVVLPDRAEAQVSCPSFYASSALSHRLADNDTCQVNLNYQTTTNGFLVEPLGVFAGLYVRAFVNGVPTTPSLSCTDNPTYVTNANAIEVNFGGATPFNTVCNASYLDNFGETVSFSFQALTFQLFGIVIDVQFLAFTVSTGGFDTVAPTLSIGAFSPAGIGSYTVPITFSENVSGLTPSDLVVANGVVTSISGSGANYVATITTTTSDALSLTVPANIVVDQGQNGNLAAGSPAIAVSTATNEVISNQLQARATHIMQSQVRLTDFVNHNSADGSALLMYGSGDAATGNLEAFANFSDPDAETAFGIWSKFEASWARNGNDDTQFLTGYLGAHAFLGPDFVLGAMLQLDTMSTEGSVPAGSKFDGWGWLIGPYLAGKLPDQPIYMEARLAYGQSVNEVSPFGTYSDKFDTSRWLATARIEGDFAMGASWSINPAMRISYFREEQEAYRDTPGNPVAGQTIQKGELEFGPSIRRMFDYDTGSRLTAELGVTGMWVFAEEGGLNSTVYLGDDELRTKLNGSLHFNATNGWSLTGNAFLDGIGAQDYIAGGGSLKILRVF